MMSLLGTSRAGPPLQVNWGGETNKSFNKKLYVPRSTLRLL